ncbi:hypothetical protein [Alteromonas flava]|uniref:hypothetical protein n=1 Tax=Alteromonas flava TaxID=2048003 RepID=UPI000C284FFB|nr:hypothetical protein [Alteromonas flava]
MFQRSLLIFQVLLAVIYFSAGLSKLFQGFPNIIGPVWLIQELAKYNLATFGYFIALSQVVIGFILFFPRLRLVGTIMLLPMHLCITVIPISLGWQGTPIINLVLLFMILTLLYDDKAKLITLVKSNGANQFSKHYAVYWCSFALFWLAALFLKYGFP